MENKIEIIAEKFKISYEIVNKILKDFYLLDEISIASLNKILNYINENFPRFSDEEKVKMIKLLPLFPEIERLKYDVKSFDELLSLLKTTKIDTFDYFEKIFKELDLL
jgi:hypothetical protein